MDKNTDKYRSEKRKQEQKLEALLLERLRNDKVVLHTEAEFEKIRIKVRQRIKASKASQKPIG